MNVYYDYAKQCQHPYSLKYNNQTWKKLQMSNLHLFYLVEAKELDIEFSSLNESFICFLIRF